MTKQYWAYRHIDGSIKVKAYRGEMTEYAIRDACDSDFVNTVLGPFEAENREQTEERARRELIVSDLLD